MRTNNLLTSAEDRQIWIDCGDDYELYYNIIQQRVANDVAGEIVLEHNRVTMLIDFMPDDKMSYPKLAEIFNANPEVEQVRPVFSQFARHITREHLVKLQADYDKELKWQATIKATKERKAAAAEKRAKIRQLWLAVGKELTTITCERTDTPHVFLVKNRAADRAWKALGSPESPVMTIAGETNSEFLITDIEHHGKFITFRCPQLTVKLSRDEFRALVKHVASTLDFSTLVWSGPRGGSNAANIPGWTLDKRFAGLDSNIGVPNHTWYDTGRFQTSQRAIPQILVDAVDAALLEMLK